MKLALYIAIPSVIVIAVVWLVIPGGLLDSRETVSRMTYVNVPVKSIQTIYDTSYRNVYVKRIIPRQVEDLRDSTCATTPIDTLQKTASSCDTLYKKIRVRRIDTVYLHYSRMEKMKVDQKYEEVKSGFDYQSFLTWFIGSINSIIIVMLGIKKLLIRNTIAKKRKSVRSKL